VCFFIRLSLNVKSIFKGLKTIPGISFAYPVEANEIFIRLPPPLLDIIKVLEKKYSLLTEEPGVYRLVCSFDTERAEIDEFLELALKTVSESK
jgi:threonine aldolase